MMKLLLIALVAACGGAEKKPAPAPAPIANAAPAPAPAPPPPPPPAPTPPSSKVPPECIAYGEVIKRAATCPAMPKASQDALLEAYKQMMTAIEADESPADSRASMAEGCKAGIDGMTQAMTSMGCP
jgi:hypothetical protein